jgi:HAD superfamily hydrolase (TIGR01509 family)
MRFEGLILDFDGVLLESEYVGNKQIADYLTSIGHPTTPEDSMREFMGLAEQPFLAAIEGWIGRAVPEDFHAARKAEDERVLAEGLEAVAGAVAFVETLPPDLPKAIASSSSTHWIRSHLDHLGLRARFEPHLYSGREHVERGKPAPDLYLRAAMEIGVPIERVAIVEDSPVGVTGAVASGAFVIGITAGNHCLDRHGERLKALGVHALAESFEEARRILFGT